MHSDDIAEIGINHLDQLFVKPKTAIFPYVYREAMEVHWDANAMVLYSPKPREWSYLQWFQQIIAAAKEQGTSLIITTSTQWSNVPKALRQEIEKLEK